MKIDTGSRSEADSARFQHAHVEPDEPHDDPDPAPLTHVDTCPVRDGCQDTHPWHGDVECQVDVGNGGVDPQLAEQCPCVGACEGCRGYGVVEWVGVDRRCLMCAGTGRAWD